MIWKNLEFPKGTEKIGRELESTPGLKVVSAREWTLPIYACAMPYDVGKSKRLNIIEEYIMKIASAGLDDIPDIEYIADLLELDSVFIKTYVDELAEAGAIEEDSLPKIIITEQGKEFYEEGKIYEDPERRSVKLLIDPYFNSPSLYGTKKTGNNICPNYSDLKAPAASKDVTLSIEDLVNVAKQQGKIIEQNGSDHKIIATYPCEKAEKINSVFVEFWIYDILEEDLYCKIYNISDEGKASYCRKISEYYTSHFKPPLELSDEIKYRDGADVGPEQNDLQIQNRLKETLKIERDIFNNRSSSSMRDTKKEIQRSSLYYIRDSQIKPEFNRLLETAKKRVIIYSPWINENVVDDDMIGLFQRLVKRGVVVLIGWGIAAKYEYEEGKPPDSLMNRLGAIVDRNGIPSVLKFWKGNRHNKEVLIDDSVHISGSFNWLSFRGDRNLRGETVTVVTDKELIEDQVRYLEEMFIEDLKKYASFEVTGLSAIKMMGRFYNNKDEIGAFIRQLIAKYVKDKNHNQIAKVAYVYLGSEVMPDYLIEAIRKSHMEDKDNNELKKLMIDVRMSNKGLYDLIYRE